MALQNKYQRLSLETIHVPRDERQRREIDTTDLEPSIAKRGVIQPIIVEKLSEPIGSCEYLLIAGERRWTASIRLGLKDIPARLASDLSIIERQILELEENVKRTDLDWKDHVAAIKRIHELYKLETPAQTQDDTADSIGMSRGNISIAITVAEEIAKGNKQVIAAGGYRAAYNIIQRHEERRVADVMNDLLSEPAHEEPKPSAHPQVGSKVIAPALVKLPAPAQVESILNTDFLKWVELFAGRPYSFIHCDFPYGINLDRSEQANSDSWGGYADSPDIYFTLCKSLARNLDKLMTQSGHLMFWCSSDITSEVGVHATIQFFKKAAPSLEFIPIPLVWHKTDNKGILSDPKRRARHVYETALVASRNDRLIVKAVSDAYGAPTSKEVHQSEKPEPMLRHFFQMFVDEHTTMLDPTCGSGTSLRAAESLGAKEVLGLEINPSFCESARTLLKKFRNLRSLEKPNGKVASA